MNYEQKRDALLKKLYKETGITFEITENTNDEVQTIEKLEQLLHHLPSDDNRNFFFQQFLLGQLPKEEIVPGLHRFHVEKGTPVVLFLIAFRQPYSRETLSILSSMSSPGADHFVKMDDTHVAWLRELKTAATEEELYETVASTTDMLGTEAMISARIAYDRCVSDPLLLPELYQNAYLALEIGSLFFASETVLSYHRMGMEKLIFQLPHHACIEFLHDHFTDFDFKDLDSESRNTIQAFLDNGLSIAETARALYVHRNTLIYRIDKFEKQTGLDIRKFEDAMICKIGLMIADALIAGK
ncbi:MAG: helix-turn-helix domain-containing protein [Lachnospiraceae bacterium]|nr:helix-turn-helix domain-containing protein [Lachnospiraceae bacterium]